MVISEVRPKPCLKETLLGGGFVWILGAPLRSAGLQDLDNCALRISLLIPLAASVDCLVVASFALELGKGNSAAPLAAQKTPMKSSIIMSILILPFSCMGVGQRGGWNASEEHS